MLNRNSKFGMKAQVVQKAIPRMGLIYKNAYDAKADLQQFWQLLVDFDPDITLDVLAS